MTTLKTQFDLYRPKAKDEQDFVDKHVVNKVQDRNGNKDDVFNGNTKPVDRKKTRLGYNPNEDQDVYEETEELDEAVTVSHDRYLRSHGKRASGVGAWIFTHKKSGNIDLADDKKSHIGKGKFTDAAKAAKAWAKKHGHGTIYVAENFDEDSVRAYVLEMAELSGDILEEEELEVIISSIIGEETNISEAKVDMDDFRKVSKKAKEESKNGYVQHVDRHKNGKHSISDWMSDDTVASFTHGKHHGGHDVTEETDSEGGMALNQLATAERSVKALMPKIKKDTQLPAWVQAKLTQASSMLNGVANYMTGPSQEKIGEEVEDLDELSKGTLSNYIRKASPKVASHTASQMTSKDIGNMEYHGKKVIKRLKGIDTAAKKLTKEDVINRAIAKYASVDESNLPSRGERMLNRLEGLSETHVNTLMDLFNTLNEDNQAVMLEAANTDEGLLNLLDFAINKGGE